MTDKRPTPACHVRGCEKPAETVWEFPEEGPTRQSILCLTHRDALNGGAHFAEMGQEILMGRDLPPEILTFRSRTGDKGDYLTLVLGWDGVPDQEIRVRVREDLLRDMADWVPPIRQVKKAD